MQNLTVTAFYSRLAIKYAIAFLVFLVLARIAWQVGFGIYRHYFPPAPPPPTVSFGKLPELAFPSQEGIAKFSYTLELPEGDFPKTPTILPVFVQPAPRSSIVALDQARRIAQRLGFTGGEESLSQSIYRFRKKEVPAALQMNIITGAFSINYDLLSDPAPAQTRPPTAEVAAATIRSSLSGANIWPEDFTEGRTNSLFLKNEGGQLVLALSLSDANFVKVDFFRKNYNDIVAVTPAVKQGNVWFLVSGATSSERRIVAGEYHYFPVEEERSSTYPVKTSQVAWEELNAGQGSIINPGANKNNVVIRRVYLAYYDNNLPQEFFQPVFVFEGDNEFVAYVPAVTRDYYGK